MKKYVIAIGGNALEEKKQFLNEIFQKIAESIAILTEKGAGVVLVFGNGPQIGKLVMQNHYASTKLEENTIDECVAMTQALIGNQLETEIGNALAKYGVNRKIVNVMTQVIVDEEEFKKALPTKPIGPSYSKEEVLELQKQQPDAVFKLDVGRGYRRVVVSPRPKKIREIDTICSLLKEGHIVIAGGGGGIPMVNTKTGEFLGVDAVIDKDFTAEKIAEEIGAEELILLTGVDYVAIHFGTTEEKSLKKVSLQELDEYIKNGEFSEGSMLPKIQAAKMFVEKQKGRTAVIGTIGKLLEILQKKSGTVISE